MVKQFLLDYEQELLGKKIDLMKSLQKSELSIKENKEYIHFIEISEDKSYESFSPQSYNTKNNKIKLKELKESQKQLEEISISKKSELELIDKKLKELSKVIEKVRNDETDKMHHDINTTNAKETFNSILHKIDFCINLVDIDSKRCKLELQDISKSLRKLINDNEVN